MLNFTRYLIWSSPHPPKKKGPLEDNDITMGLLQLQFWDQSNCRPLPTTAWQMLSDKIIVEISIYFQIFEVFLGVSLKNFHENFEIYKVSQPICNSKLAGLKSPCAEGIWLDHAVDKSCGAFHLFISPTSKTWKRWRI